MCRPALISSDSLPVSSRIMARPRPFSICLLLPCVLLLAGCGDGQKKVTRYPVSGTVTFDGKPLDAGKIQFTNPADGGIDGMEIKGGSFKGEVQAGKRKVEITAMREAGNSPM